MKEILLNIEVEKEKFLSLKDNHDDLLISIKHVPFVQSIEGGIVIFTLILLSSLFCLGTSEVHFSNFMFIFYMVSTILFSMFLPFGMSKIMNLLILQSIKNNDIKRKDVIKNYFEVVFYDTQINGKTIDLLKINLTKQQYSFLKSLSFQKRLTYNTLLNFIENLEKIDNEIINNEEEKFYINAKNIPDLI